jgi:hypothetical protein
MHARRVFLFGAAWGAVASLSSPAVGGSEPGAQPFFAGVQRVIEGLNRAGCPLPPAVTGELQALAAVGDATAVARARLLLADFVIARVTLSAQGDGKIEVRPQVLPLVE